MTAVLEKPNAVAEAVSLRDRLVDRVFGTADGVLTIGDVKVTDLAREYGTPFYAYDAAVMRHNYKALSDAVAGFAEVYYSIKANPAPEVAAIFHDLGAGLEIASLNEFDRARTAGCAPERIIFAGPGKGQHELAATVEAGVGEIHLESFEEAEHVARLGERFGRKVAVAVRVNPVAGAQGGAMRMGGKPTAFGFDEEDLAEVVARIEAFDALDLQGVHLFAGTQILKASVLVSQWRHGLDVARTVADLTGRPMKSIDLGGGLGVPYHEGDGEIDLAELKASVRDLIAEKAADPRVADAHVVLEPGRFLTANAGAYVLGVRAVKHSRGQRFIVTDGGMHHHLAASGNLGQVIKRDYPLVAADKMDAPDRLQANVVGPLCTPLDTLGRQTELPEVAQGNLIAVLQSGAYGLSASPVNFLSHPLAAEVMVDGGAHRRIGG
jgi:diaminopimelate decarboxylase